MAKWTSIEIRKVRNGYLIDAQPPPRDGVIELASLLVFEDFDRMVAAMALGFGEVELTPVEDEEPLPTREA